jgi:riboflavin synthase
VKSKSSSGRAIEYWIKAPGSLSRYIAEKGSIAVDGISLTVAALNGDRLGIQIIPFTREHTTLADRRAGDRVNLEADIIGKYAARLAELSRGPVAR